jgi:hypothetical protein
MVLLIKSDQKPRKKSDLHKNVYQKNQRHEQEEENEPEWMRDECLSPDINEFQLKTLEYEFKKVLNVKKSYDDRFAQPSNTNKELFADVDQILERNARPLVKEEFEELEPHRESKKSKVNHN